MCSQQRVRDSQCLGKSRSYTHASAFGAGILSEKVDDFIQYANEKLSNISYDPSYEVDFIFDGSDVDTQVIADIASMRSLWGKGID